jgi:hypothetical protein
VLLRRHIIRLVIVVAMVGILGSFALSGRASGAYPPTTTTTTTPPSNDPTKVTSPGNPLPVASGDQEDFALDEFCANSSVTTLFNGVNYGIVEKVDSNGVLNVPMVWLPGGVSIGGSAPIPDRLGENVLTFKGCSHGVYTQRNAYFLVQSPAHGTTGTTGTTGNTGITGTTGITGSSGTTGSQVATATAGRSTSTTAPSAQRCPDCATPKPNGNACPPISACSPIWQVGASSPALWWTIRLLPILLLGAAAYVLARRRPWKRNDEQDPDEDGAEVNPGGDGAEPDPSSGSNG